MTSVHLRRRFDALRRQCRVTSHGHYRSVRRLAQRPPPSRDARQPDLPPLFRVRRCWLYHVLFILYDVSAPRTLLQYIKHILSLCIHIYTTLLTNPMYVCVLYFCIRSSRVFCSRSSGHLVFLLSHTFRLFNLYFLGPSPFRRRYQAF